MEDTSFVSGGYVTQMPLTKNKADVYSRGINRGLDIAVKKGTPVELPKGRWQVVHSFNKATAEGPNNKQRGINEGYGNRVVAVNLDTGEKISFAHLSKVNVRVGDLISGGTVGYSGATGNVAGRTGAHVDIEYYDATGSLGDVTKTNYWNGSTAGQQQQIKQGFSLVKQANAAESNFNNTIVRTPPQSTPQNYSTPSVKGASSYQVQPLISSQPKSNTQLINRGDSLSKIAQQYNTTWQNLAKMNPQIKDPNKIYAGDVLYVPQPRVVTTGKSKQSSSTTKVKSYYA